MSIVRIQQARGRRRTLVGLFAFCLFVVLGTVPATAQPAGDAPGLARAEAAKAAHADALLDIDGVAGIGVGLDARGNAAVVVTAARPGVAGIPQSLDGVTVRVLVTGSFYANPKPNCAVDPSHPSCKNDDDDGGGGKTKIDPTSKFARPVPIGVSTGNEASCSAGTIGARVTDGANVFALSNNHVYAEENAAATGALASDDTGSDTILQPGRYDTNCVPDNDPLGVLYDYIPLDFDGGDNFVDAALALTGTDRLENGTPADGYGVPNSVTRSADLGLGVQKYGRSTGLTRGTIVIINWEGDVGYNSGTAHFVDQFVVESSKGPFVKAGDSGSLVVTDDTWTDTVGLMFAGNRSGKYGIVNRIGYVLNAFGVSIDGR